MWGEKMGDAIIKKDIFLDLSVEDDGFGFSTSIADAMAKAEAELVVLNETVDSIKGLKPDCDKLIYSAASSGALWCYRHLLVVSLVSHPWRYYG